MNMTAWFACLLGVSAGSGCRGYKEADEVTQLCVQTQELEYLAAFGSVHHWHGYKDPVHQNPRLKMVFQGTKPWMTAQTTWQPITAQVPGEIYW